MRRIHALMASVAIAAVLSLNASASVETLLPRPQQISSNGRTFTVKSVDLSVPAWSDAYAGWFNKSGVGIKAGALPVRAEIADSVSGAPAGNEEAYSLEITPAGINIKATSEAGIHLALQTIRQLAEQAPDGTLTLPECNITDWPAFPWRGLLIDTGRTYISPEELKREIDALELFKMNVFHFHFTENQAWRMESKVFPQLNDSANMARQPGLYYTLEEARELADYAAERGVLFLPEVDMPGHSAAFEKTFGVTMQTPEGREIIKKLVDEVCETFPDVPYLHIGTDEVQFTDSTFVPDMVAYVRSKGKKAATWNPGWRYAPGEIDLSQMWSYRGRPVPGIPSIDSRFHYLNHFDTYADLVALYRSSIYGQPQATPDIIGTEIAVWNDRFVADERNNVAMNNIYPSVMAIAERSWLGGGTEYFDSLGTNIATPGSDDFNQFADFERRMLHHKATSLADAPIAYVAQTPVRWRITEAFPNGGDLTASFPPEQEGMKLTYTYADSIFTTGEASGAGIYLRHVWGTLIPTYYKNPKPNHTAYAFTRVYSPVDQTVGLQAETQNYSRSEPDVAPPQGKWDFRDSRIFINGEEINPPVWTATHSKRDNELSLGNENMAARAPLQVKLKKGWNDVMLKLPVGEFSTPETRLVKWMFTFVFTTPDGSEAAPGLIYSSEVTD